MSTARTSDETNIACLNSYYEELASQEEIYEEEIEEELRMILECDAPESTVVTDLNLQREEAAEDLVAGDADEPPLSEEEIKNFVGTS